MNQTEYNQDLFRFLSSSPTPFHAVASIEDFLRAQNFIELKENSYWQLQRGCGYFLSRENGATIAFILGSKEQADQGFRVLAAHTDSPSLQIKPKADLKTGSYHQLGVEVYGGSLLSTWFDRDLSLAGRLVCETDGGQLAVLLINFNRPLLTIPSIAIHFNREANSGNPIDRQKHLPPVLAQCMQGQVQGLNSLLLAQTVLEHPAIAVQKVLSFDLFCYDYQGPAYTGANQEFISASRLDNLLSCHAGMTAIGQADRTKNCLLLCTNHEENGSMSATGAQGSFIDSVLERLLPEPEKRRITLRNSFLISMDNAHASHPNFMDKMDTSHGIDLNKGPVIKINANQRYATNSLTAAVYKHLCREAGIEPQEFVMRSDLACGSTIGPLTAARLGVHTLDVGAPTLAMHSIREHTGSSDPFLLYRSVATFLNSDTHRQLLC